MTRARTTVAVAADFDRLLGGASHAHVEAAVARLVPDHLDLLNGQLAVRAAQRPPRGDWTTWLILAGRGFGKTRTGAAWIDTLAKEQRGIRIALIGTTAADARAVMVEGEAGLLATNAEIVFEPSRRRLEWPGGSTAMLYSASDAEAVRGPSFHYAWGDEAANWDDGERVIANLRMALRLGPLPRLLLTTTPRPLRWLQKLSLAPGVATTRGRTHDNAANLPPPFLDGLTRDYAGTRLGRQELDGEFIDDHEGALWTRSGIEACRIGSTPQCVRVVVGVDPPAGVGGRADACGIVVAGIDARGDCYVLGDRSVQGLSPDGWARAVVAAADEFDADLVIAEVNNGGAMVAAMLHSVDAQLNVRSVHAAAGKVARAEPVASRYAAGRVFHVGCLPALEDELCALGVGGAWTGPGSPDRADAMVWALSELMSPRGRREPGVRML